jgi:hypothetical protein
MVLSGDTVGLQNVRFAFDRKNEVAQLAVDELDRSRLFSLDGNNLIKNCEVSPIG